MMFEDLADMVSDFAGDISENINDAVVDIGEFSKGAMEALGDKGIEALENGDLKGVIEGSDIPKENKEMAKEIVGIVNVPSALISGAKVVSGTLGTVAALATPGFQPAGVAALSLAVKGAQELASQFSSKNANALANA